MGGGGNPTRCSALTSLMPLGWPFDQVGCKDTWYILIILGPVRNPPCFGPLNIIEYQPPICVCLCASLLPMAHSLGPVRACQPDFSLPIEKRLPINKPLSILRVVSSGTVYLESSQFRAISNPFLHKLSMRILCVFTQIMWSTWGSYNKC